MNYIAFAEIDVIQRESFTDYLKHMYVYCPKDLEVKQ